ncbi:transcriptional repressor [Flavobacterium piscis]|uniref:Fur family ferric uptake transcriptional regulator n=1 Tax=Flavobacterium piscis TaxID=1114874 RepID=A0ABU1YB28_9FLAO|nr:transcriptional repressor [Flavobacterium piscis]MDR7211440.1 Fur family ferric uptake transcriptional regulator [Flavobacterium piscis]
MIPKATAILKENGLKITQNRLDVLAVFLGSEKAFSLLDLEKILHSKHDRSSIFRNLQTYSEKGILEKFCNASGTAIYALNLHKPNCNGTSHFKCKDCDTVVSLPGLPAEYLEILGNNKMETMNLLIEGTCEKCQIKNPNTL